MFPESLARQMHLTPRHFNRTFKNRFGISPRAYQTHACLREAACRLRSTDQSIKAVAFELGFKGPKLFTRLFKSLLEIRPSELRIIQTEQPLPPPRGGKLFPMNTHLMPPETPTDWQRRFIAKRGGHDTEIMSLRRPHPGR